jgi:hypothetical protein
MSVLEVLRGYVRRAHQDSIEQQGRGCCLEYGWQQTRLGRLRWAMLSICAGSKSLDGVLLVRAL